MTNDRERLVERLRELADDISHDKNRLASEFASSSKEWDGFDEEASQARATIEAAIAALAHPPAQEGAVTKAQGWRGMASAPKDGTRILLGNRWGTWVGYYCDRYQSGYRPPNPWHSMMLNHDHMKGCMSLEPSGWQPLPTPPVNQSEVPSHD